MHGAGRNMHRMHLTRGIQGPAIRTQVQKAAGRINEATLEEIEQAVCLFQQPGLMTRTSGPAAKGVIGGSGGHGVFLKGCGVARSVPMLTSRIRFRPVSCGACVGPRLCAFSVV